MSHTSSPRDSDGVCSGTAADGASKHGDDRLLVYERRPGWVALDLRELWRYRELLYFLSWRDVKVRYKQAVLGVLWAVLQPFITMVVFTLVFNRVLGVQSPDPAVPYAIFSLSGLVPWGYFSGSLSRAGGGLVSNANLLTKVYFPRLVIPISAILAGLIDLAISFVILLLVMAFYGIAPAWTTIFVPLFVILAMATALSVGLWLSALNVLYRDVQYIIPFLIQLWMFVSPVIYPITKVPQSLRVVFALNPMTGVIAGFRWALFGEQFPGPYLWVSLGVVVVLMVSGLYYFKRVERIFADVV
jgi:lipopolysaccharide transport system permease protein